MKIFHFALSISSILAEDLREGYQKGSKNSTLQYMYSYLFCSLLEGLNLWPKYKTTK